MNVNPALESIQGGLIVSVVGLICGVVGANWHDLFGWVRQGFSQNTMRAKHAAALCVFLGVVPFGILQIAARSLPYPISPNVRMLVAIPGWLVIGYGVIIWQSVLMAEARGTNAGRRWMLILFGSVALCVTIIGSTANFHAPVPMPLCAPCDAR